MAIYQQGLVTLFYYYQRFRKAFIQARISFLGAHQQISLTASEPNPVSSLGQGALPIELYG